MSASTLRSSSWDRTAHDLAILDDETIGRNKILAIQLQGHLFFGNVAVMADEIKETLNEVKGTDIEPWIIILDFSLVVAMDSSAAHAIVKLKSILQNTLHVDVTIFVTGCPDGFPCEFNLSKELSNSRGEDANSVSETRDAREEIAGLLKRNVPISRVCTDLDSALILAEDILLARAVTNGNNQSVTPGTMLPSEQDTANDEDVSLDEELALVVKFVTNLYEGKHLQDVSVLVRLLKRQVYNKGDILWKQGSDSDSAVILMRGSVVSHLEGTEQSSESIPIGNFLGELGLVYGAKRLTTVEIVSDIAVVYSLSKVAWEDLSERQPRVARIMDMIVIRYLTKRCQHPSNRIFETRCLPI